MEHQLERLRTAQLLVATGDDDATFFQVRPDLRRPVRLLMEALPRAPSAEGGEASEAAPPGEGGEPVPASGTG